MACADNVLSKLWPTSLLTSLNFKWITKASFSYTVIALDRIEVNREYTLANSYNCILAIMATDKSRNEHFKITSALQDFCNYRNTETYVFSD